MHFNIKNATDHGKIDSKIKSSTTNNFKKNRKSSLHYKVNERNKINWRLDDSQIRRHYLAEISSGITGINRIDLRGPAFVKGHLKR